MDVFDLCTREKNRILIMNVIVEAMIREQKVDAVLDEVLLLLVTQRLENISILNADITAGYHDDVDIWRVDVGHIVGRPVGQITQSHFIQRLFVLWLTNRTLPTVGRLSLSVSHQSIDVSLGYTAVERIPAPSVFLSSMFLCM